MAGNGGTNVTWPQMFLGVLVVLVGLAIVDNINPKLGTYYVIAVLLGVALTHQRGVQEFTQFMLSQVRGLPR